MKLALQTRSHRPLTPTWDFALKAGDAFQVVPFTFAAQNYEAIVWTPSDLTDGSLVSVLRKGRDPFSLLVIGQGGAGGAGGNQAGAGTAGGGGGGGGGFIRGAGPAPASVESVFRVSRELAGLRIEWNATAGQDTVVADGAAGGADETNGANAAATTSLGLASTADLKHPGGGGGGGGTAGTKTGGTSPGGASGGNGSAGSPDFRGGGGGGINSVGVGGATTGNGGDGEQLQDEYEALLDALGFSVPAFVCGGGGGGVNTGQTPGAGTDGGATGGVALPGQAATQPGGGGGGGGGFNPTAAGGAGGPFLVAVIYPVP